MLIAIPEWIHHIRITRNGEVIGTGSFSESGMKEVVLGIIKVEYSTEGAFKPISTIFSKIRRYLNDNNVVVTSDNRCYLQMCIDHKEAELTKLIDNYRGD